MENQNERLTTCISNTELERRWKAAREMMREHHIDYLIIRNDEDYLGGNVKWFSDLSAQHGYPMTVIFPIDEEMTLISPGPQPPAEPSPPPWAARGVKKRLSAPYFPCFHYTSSYDAERAVDVLKEKKGATIGLVGRSYFPVNFCEYLWQHLPGSNFIDATDEIDQIKAIKSEEEIELIKGTAQLQDAAIENLRQTIKPGQRDYEIFAQAQYFTVLQGSERGLILVGSGPAENPGRYMHRHFQNRVIMEGDTIAVLIEVNGPGGLYTEIGRLFSVGEPSQEMQDANGIAVEAQKISLDILKPGADPKEIWEASNAFLEKNGFAPDRRLYAHGQGHGLVERPAIRYDEPMKIKAGMNIAIHPGAVNKRVWTTVCDNYLVTETGVGPCLHKTPKEIIVV